MKVIAVTNQKGGVGKTTTAANLSAFFADRGKRVLMLDMDGQGHVAPVLRMQRFPGLLRVLVAGEKIDDVAVQARPNLWIVPNDHTAEQVKSWAQTVGFREFLIATALEDVSYDLVVIDTPPSTDLLHVAALVASDYVIVPAQMDYLALDGIGHVIKTLRSLAKFPNVTPPNLIGILPTMYDRTTVETLQNIQRLQQDLPAELILPPIARDTKVREAASYGQTIFEYAPNSAAAIGWPQKAKARNSMGNVGGYLHLGEIVETVLRQP